MKVKTLLNKPENWIKGQGSNGRGGYCLYGALSKCYSTNSTAYRVAVEKLKVAIQEYTHRKTLPDIIVFNDRQKTTYKDIKAVLKIANV